MKVFFLSLSLLFTVSLSNLYYWNQRKRAYEKALIYQSEIILLVLEVLGVLQIPLAIFLGIASWKALITVYVVFIFARLNINGFLERWFLGPLFLLILRRTKKLKERKERNRLK